MQKDILYDKLLPMKLICAPMATLSNEAFRHVIEAFGGCDEYYTEMINAGSLLTNGPFEKYYLCSGPVPEKIVWQLTGKDAEHLAAAASIVAEHGGIGIDLNMGCSAPEIYKTGAGIAWMCKPLSETRKMVAQVKRALDSTVSDQVMRLSVKLRLGDENFTDEGFFSFCDMLYEEGVTRLVLHPRTRREKYRKPPRWEYVQRLAEHFAGKNNMSVVLNGAVGSIADAKKAVKAAPAAEGIMIGRAAAQTPWIFRELQCGLHGSYYNSGTANVAPEKDDEKSDIFDLREKFIKQGKDGTPVIDLLSIALEYIALIQIYQPPEFWKTRLQRFFFYYCDNFSFAHYIRTKMLNASTPDEFSSRITAYFHEVPEDRYLSAPFLSSLSHD